MLYKGGSIEEGESLLSSSDDHSSVTRKLWRGRSVQVMLIIFGVLTTFALGFVLGSRIGNRNLNHYGLIAPPGSIQTKWEHNYTFTRKPGTESEGAWGSLIPVGRGFIYHSQLAPSVSNIAVFHQLHCLHTIYVAYYTALESPAISNLTAVQEVDETTGTRTAVFHIRHCIDYIRQSILCAADTNLEVIDPVTHATNGWNQTKQCRNYDSVVKWAERYANTTDTGIISSGMEGVGHR